MIIMHTMHRDYKDIIFEVCGKRCGDDLEHATGRVLDNAEPRAASRALLHIRAAPGDATMMAPAFLALAAAVCFGSALVVGRLGLRHTSPLAGATISITVTLLGLLLLSPELLRAVPLRLGGLLVFAAVGIFYPAVVMLLSYTSNRVLGPTLTGAAASTTPVFAAAAAAVVLRESVDAHVYFGGGVTVVGLALLALKAPMRESPGWRIALPLTGAALRGVAQMLIKFGLTLWPSPFAAALLSYTGSTAVMWAVNLARPGHRARLARAGLGWFVAAGILNGTAVLLMYHALQGGHVAEISTLVAAYPLVTLALSAAFLKTEALGVRTLLAVTTVVLGIAIVLYA